MSLFTKFISFFNMLLLAVIVRQSFIVHGDGPGGFFELMTKILLGQISLACFAFFIFYSLKMKKNDKTTGMSITTSVIFCIFCIFVFDACSDTQGYCRKWHFYSSSQPCENLISAAS